MGLERRISDKVKGHPKLEAVLTIHADAVNRVLGSTFDEPGTHNADTQEAVKALAKLMAVDFSALNSETNQAAIRTRVAAQEIFDPLSETPVKEQIEEALTACGVDATALTAAELNSVYGEFERLRLAHLFRELPHAQLILNSSINATTTQVERTLQANPPANPPANPLQVNQAAARAALLRGTGDLGTAFGIDENMDVLFTKPRVDITLQAFTQAYRAYFPVGQREQATTDAQNIFNFYNPKATLAQVTAAFTSYSKQHPHLGFDARQNRAYAQRQFGYLKRLQFRDRDDIHPLFSTIFGDRFPQVGDKIAELGDQFNERWLRSHICDEHLSITELGQNLKLIGLDSTDNARMLYACNRYQACLKNYAKNPVMRALLLRFVEHFKAQLADEDSATTVDTAIKQFAEMFNHEPRSSDGPEMTQFFNHLGLDANTRDALATDIGTIRHLDNAAGNIGLAFQNLIGAGHADIFVTYLKQQFVWARDAAPHADIPNLLARHHFADNQCYKILAETYPANSPQASLQALLFNNSDAATQVALREHIIAYPDTYLVQLLPLADPNLSKGDVNSLLTHMGFHNLALETNLYGANQFRNFLEQAGGWQAPKTDIDFGEDGIIDVIDIAPRVTARFLAGAKHQALKEVLADPAVRTRILETFSRRPQLASQWVEVLTTSKNRQDVFLVLTEMGISNKNATKNTEKGAAYHLAEDIVKENKRIAIAHKIHNKPLAEWFLSLRVGNPSKPLYLTPRLVRGVNGMLETVAYKDSKLKKEESSGLKKADLISDLRKKVTTLDADIGLDDATFQAISVNHKAIYTLINRYALLRGQLGNRSNRYTPQRRAMKEREIEILQRLMHDDAFLECVLESDYEGRDHDTALNFAKYLVNRRDILAYCDEHPEDYDPARNHEFSKEDIQHFEALVRRIMPDYLESEALLSEFAPLFQSNLSQDNLDLSVKNIANAIKIIKDSQYELFAGRKKFFHLHKERQVIKQRVADLADECDLALVDEGAAQKIDTLWTEVTQLRNYFGHVLQFKQENLADIRKKMEAIAGTIAELKSNDDWVLPELKKLQKQAEKNTKKLEKSIAKDTSVYVQLDNFQRELSEAHERMSAKQFNHESVFVYDNRQPVVIHTRAALDRHLAGISAEKEEEAPHNILERARDAGVHTDADRAVRVGSRPINDDEAGRIQKGEARDIYVVHTTGTQRDGFIIEHAGSTKVETRFAGMKQDDKGNYTVGDSKEAMYSALKAVQVALGKWSPNLPTKGDKILVRAKSLDEAAYLYEALRSFGVNKDAIMVMYKGYNMREAQGMTATDIAAQWATQRDLKKTARDIHRGCDKLKWYQFNVAERSPVRIPGISPPKSSYQEASGIFSGKRGGTSTKPYQTVRTAAEKVEKEASELTTNNPSPTAY